MQNKKWTNNGRCSTRIIKIHLDEGKWKIGYNIKYELKSDKMQMQKKKHQGGTNTEAKTVKSTVDFIIKNY